MGPGTSQSQPSSISRAQTRQNTPMASQITAKEWYTRDQILKQGGPVQNVKEARKYLEQNGIVLAEEFNTNKVAEAMLRVSSDSNTENYLTFFGPKHLSKHLAKYFRYFARCLSSNYLR
jgi:hypothetical protein